MAIFYQPVSFQDEIMLGESGKKISFSFSPDEISERYFQLIKGLTLEEKNKETENAEKYGALFVELIVLLFGEKNAQILLDFYKDDYRALINSVIFYTGTKIAPVMREASRRRKKRIKAEKKAMRTASMRRWFH